jgi:hypothetical protein
LCWISHLDVFGLSQDLQELIIGQEVEAREAGALGLQIVLKVLRGSKWTRSKYAG